MLSTTTIIKTISKAKVKVDEEVSVVATVEEEATEVVFTINRIMKRITLFTITHQLIGNPLLNSLHQKW